MQTNSQELEIAGYYENQFFPQEFNDKLILQDYNKLRLDLSAGIGENVSFSADYIYRVFHGATLLNTFDFIPQMIVQEYADLQQSSVDSLRPDFDFELEDESFLDNAYVTVYFGHLNLRIGRQQLPWGTGYTWNPTDIFNEKNTLDPAYEKVGVNAFKLEVPFGREGLLTGILGVGEDWEASTKALKVKQHSHGFDFSASFVQKQEDRFDYILDSESSEKRGLLGVDFSGELLGLGVWGEGAYNFMELDDDFYEFIVGGDYTFESGLYTMLEYHRNSSGKSDYHEYDLNDWMRLMASEQKAIARELAACKRGMHLRFAFATVEELSRGIRDGSIR